MKARVFLLIGALGASLALTSCGVKTGLETPPPMWGKARREYKEQERLKAEAAMQAAGSTAPSTMAPLPPPSAPIAPGSQLSPFATTPMRPSGN